MTMAMTASVSSMSSAGSASVVDTFLRGGGVDRSGQSTSGVGGSRSVLSTAGASVSKAPSKVEPLLGPIPFSDRLRFAVFPQPCPRPSNLNASSRGKSTSKSAGKPERRTVSTGRQPKKDVTSAEHTDGGDVAEPEKLFWFTIDEDLVYLSFFGDWGPLNCAQFYRFCIHVHQMLMDDSLQEHVLVLYTEDDPAKKANAALLIALYVMIIDKKSPAGAFQPLAEIEFVPFRDAGYGVASYHLSIQDILYGMHRAISLSLLDLSTFDLDEYEYFEQVANGDWNWITPNFIAFASPSDRNWLLSQRAGEAGKKAGGTSGALDRPLPITFQNTVSCFKERGVKMVVRLNNPLYDRTVFEAAGIEHLDMYFDDGSNPSEHIVREFIRRVDDVVESGGVIAVHCKAGLGRTGVLIGAYLIWKHGFTASEVIGFMRIMRPGCVVGPQQHFMYQNMMTWVQWGAEHRAMNAAKEAAAAAAVAASVSSPLAPRSKRPITPPDEENTPAMLPVTPPRETKVPRAGSREPASFTAATPPAVKPTPVVGQPRKSPSPNPARRMALAEAKLGNLSNMGTMTVDRSHLRHQRMKSAHVLISDPKGFPSTGAPTASDRLLVEEQEEEDSDFEGFMDVDLERVPMSTTPTNLPTSVRRFDLRRAASPSDSAEANKSDDSIDELAMDRQEMPLSASPVRRQGRVPSNGSTSRLPTLVRADSDKRAEDTPSPKPDDDVDVKSSSVRRPTSRTTAPALAHARSLLNRTAKVGAGDARGGVGAIRSSSRIAAASASSTLSAAGLSRTRGAANPGVSSVVRASRATGARPVSMVRESKEVIEDKGKDARTVPRSLLRPAAVGSRGRAVPASAVDGRGPRRTLRRRRSSLGEADVCV